MLFRVTVAQLEICFGQYQATSAEHWVMCIYSAYCQVTEWFSADVNDSQFYVSQVLKDCLGDVKRQSVCH